MIRTMKRRASRYSAAAVAIAVSTVGCAAFSAEPGTARVDSGVLHGAAAASVVVFKGVPYAKPPIGILRWAPPEKPEPWREPRDAVAFGPSCPQGPVVASLIAGAASGPASEDCLTLNVWAPLGARGAPVMVWLHGGGNQQGGSSIPFYDGASFARDGVVLVTVNYRLGPLGFFAHPSLGSEGRPAGNYGLMDQIAALDWVRRNARAFGGDPTQVTVFGESAGGQDILLLLASKAAKGLFSKAIVESGGGWGPTRSLADAQARAREAAVSAGLPADATASQLRGLPVSAMDASAFRLASGPMIDGVIITHPSIAESFRSGAAAALPMIIGSNAGEDSLTTLAAGSEALARLSPERLAALRAAYPGVDDVLLAKNLFRDSVMGAPAHWIAGQASSGAPIWLYHFAFVPPALHAIFPRAIHGGEIPFVFETIDKAPVPPRSLTQADRDYARFVHGCWVTFAKTGHPDCPGGPAWPAYTPAEDPTMVFDTTPHVQSGFLKQPYALQQDDFAHRQAVGTP